MPRALDEVHPFDPAVLGDPFDYYRQLRAEAPVYRDPHTGIFHVSSYERVLEAVKNHQTFSNRFAPAMGGGAGGLGEEDAELAEIQKQSYPIVDTMLTADPPEHKRFRGLVNKAFTPRRVNTLVGEMQKLTHGFVDRFAERGRFEVLSEYSVLLPLTIIADQLGVPRADLSRFKRWTDGFTAQLSGMATGEDAIEAQRRILEFQHYFAAKIDEAKAAPRDDIISDLIRARIDGERSLDIGESLLDPPAAAGGRQRDHGQGHRRGDLAALPAPRPAQARPGRSQPRRQLRRRSAADFDADPEHVAARDPRHRARRRRDSRGLHGALALRLREPRRGGVRRSGVLRPAPGERVGAPRLRPRHPLLHRRDARAPRNGRRLPHRARPLRLVRARPGAPSPPRYRPNILLRGIDELHIAFTPSAA